MKNKMIDKGIKEMCDWLEFYDRQGYLPFGKEEGGFKRVKDKIKARSKGRLDRMG